MAKRIQRVKPRISCTKLGEYMVSSASRRRRIIQDQKWPQDYIVSLYADAQEAIAAFVRRGGANGDVILDTIERLLRTSPKSEWHERRVELNILALKCFMNIAPELDLRSCAIRQTSNCQPKMSLSGVEISVRPELTLLYERQGKDKSTGAVKLSFSKGNSLGDEAGAYVGVILFEYVNKYVLPSASAKCSDCVTVDVFAEKLHRAPRTSKRRISELNDACSEIAAMWPRIDPPSSLKPKATAASIRPKGH